MVEVQYRDRLGNQLLQYCLGRIIAEELGLALKAPPIEGFPSTAESVPGLIRESPLTEFAGHRVDLAAILADRSPRKIRLNGWFQRHEYYIPYRERIKDWLAFAPSVQVPRPDAEVIVHVRRGDYVRENWALPFAYYEEAIMRCRPGKNGIIIVTDDPRDPFLWRFRRWRPRFFRGNPLETLAFMSQARRLVISNSTFSWWPTVLGSPELVLCPVPRFGLWSPECHSDINLIETDRFHCIPTNTRYLPNQPEFLYQRFHHYRKRTNVRLNRWFGLSLEDR